LPAPEGRSREPDVAGRGAREVPRQRAARADGQHGRRPRGHDHRVRAPGRPDGGAGAADRSEGARRRMTAVESSVEQAEIAAAVPEFVDRDVIPVASELEHADEFPTGLVETMKQLGLFGTTIPEEYGGLGLGIDTYALIQIELSRGWPTLSGIMNGSFITG